MKFRTSRHFILVARHLAVRPIRWSTFKNYGGSIDMSACFIVWVFNFSRFRESRNLRVPTHSIHWRRCGKNFMQLAQNLWKEIGFEHEQKLKTDKNGVKVWNCRRFRAVRDLKMAAQTSVLRGVSLCNFARCISKRTDIVKSKNKKRRYGHTAHTFSRFLSDVLIWERFISISSKFHMIDNSTFLVVSPADLIT